VRLQKMYIKYKLFIYEFLKNSRLFCNNKRLIVKQCKIPGLQAYIFYLIQALYFYAFKKKNKKILKKKIKKHKNSV